MKLDCVLTAVNDDTFYSSFIPLFIESWKCLYPTVDVKIVYISTELPSEYEKFKDNIIMLNPIDEIHTGFTAQFVRILYPSLLQYENGVMITDIDMIPMSDTYFTEQISQYENDRFISYRGNVLIHENQIAMCYNIATPAIWKIISGVTCVDDVVERLRNVDQENNISGESGGQGWFLDQIHLYEYVTKWHMNTNCLVCLNDDETKFNRLDGRYLDIRNNYDSISIHIKNKEYTDFHCSRPMEKYHDINWEMQELAKLSISQNSGHSRG
mgnify:FL=1|tara:strand:+ start:345 stop:1151 length:807 start_codon:yes stop_codon:yes gene_type:complete